MCIDYAKAWFYAGPYVPSGVKYGDPSWPSASHWLVPGFNANPPIHQVDLYDPKFGSGSV